MCGRFVINITPEILREVYDLLSVPPLQPRYNVAPTQEVAAVRENPSGARELVPLHWGLVPHWARDPGIGTRMINARSETAHEKPSFRQALKHRRCVIPASGFYEWEKRGKDRIPHYIRLRGGGIMSLAGLWESWTSPEGEVLESCTILTTGANSLVQRLHDRMPVILPRDGLGLWLDRQVRDSARLAGLFQPFPAQELEEYAVSPEVNSPKNDHPGCIEPG